MCSVNLASNLPNRHKQIKLTVIRLQIDVRGVFSHLLARKSHQKRVGIGVKQSHVLPEVLVNGGGARDCDCDGRSGFCLIE